MISDNSFSIVRRFNGRTVTVVAERVEATETWQLRCYEASDLLDAYQDDNAWQAARAMIEAAFIEDDDGRDDGDEAAAK